MLLPKGWKLTEVSLLVLITMICFHTCSDERVREEAEEVDDGGGRLGNGGGRGAS